jgi:hypothetical protein
METVREIARHVPLDEVAELVRRVLGEAYPDTAFDISTKLDEDFKAIHVHWTDGPPTLDVDKLTRIFEGSRWTDGNLVNLVHIYEGEEVRFDVGFVNVWRTMSPAFIEKTVRAMEEERDGNPARFERFLRSIHYSGSPSRDATYLAYQYASRISDTESCASATATAILLANPFLYEK